MRSKSIPLLAPLVMTSLLIILILYSNRNLFTQSHTEFPNVNRTKQRLQTLSRLRLERLHIFCQKLPPASRLMIRQRELDIDIRGIFYFVKRYDFAYCPIAKTATSTILSYIQNINNKSHISRHQMHDELDAELGKAVHQERLRRDFAIFAFTRHPWSRLISGYMNSFVKGRPWARAPLEMIELRDEVLAQPDIFNSSEFSESQLGVAPSPMQFANYLISTVAKDGWEGVNVHFWPHWVKCPFCTVPFDFLGAVETFQTDVQTLAEVLDVKEFRPGVLKNVRKESNRTAKFFSFLTPDIYDAVENLYIDDFHMFGYKKSEYRHLVPDKRP